LRFFRPVGFFTADLGIYPGELVVYPRRVPPFRRIHRFKEVHYAWPTVVMETTKPFLSRGVLVEIHGRLGKVAVSRPRRLKEALREAGFNVIEVSKWEWYGEPSPVPREVLRPRVNDVPACLVAD
jgi:hypothetical protein